MLGTTKSSKHKYQPEAQILPNNSNFAPLSDDHVPSKIDHTTQANNPSPSKPTAIPLKRTYTMSQVVKNELAKCDCKIK
jgi:hypothetical protein